MKCKATLAWYALTEQSRLSRLTGMEVHFKPETESW
jgi:hypothetical protein